MCLNLTKAFILLTFDRDKIWTFFNLLNKSYV